MTTFRKTKFNILDFCGPECHLRESTTSDLESPSNFTVKEKILLKSDQKQRNYAFIKSAKIVMFKMDVPVLIKSNQIKLYISVNILKKHNIYGRL